MLDKKCTVLYNYKSCSNVYTNEDVEAIEDDDYENFHNDDWDDMIDDGEDLLDNDGIWLGSEVSFYIKKQFCSVTKILMLYLIKFSLFSTVASKSLCCNIVDFRAKLNFGFKLNFWI